jgi:hypothetical protein
VLLIPPLFANDLYIDFKRIILAVNELDASLPSQGSRFRFFPTTMVGPLRDAAYRTEALNSTHHEA